MNDSEHYVPPPPPYEHSLHNHKVADEAQALEVSKGGPFREEEKDSKHSLSDKTPSDLHTHPIIPKSAGALRGPRPLPPRPEDARQLRPRRKYGSVADLKSYHAWNVDHATVEPHTPVLPPFSAMGPSRDKASQTKHHPSASVHPSPFQYPYQSSRDTPRRNRDGRWPVSSFYPIEPSTETSLERPSHMPSQSPPYFLRQNESRLSFDPSVAYSSSQANTRPSQREMAASLYSSAVSSHATISGSCQPFLPPRHALRSTERLDMILRPHPPSVPSSPSSPTSLHGQRTRTRSEYEHRWAASESNIAADTYHG